MSIRRTSRKRVLIFAEAVTLAHVARPHVLAGLLPSAAYEVCVARDERYERLFGSRLAYGTTRIHSIPTEQFLRALEDGQPVYQPDSLRGYVEEDLQVIGKFDPDLVIGDFRLSLSISCRLAGKPYVSLANAYWSPYARPRYRVPELPIVKWMGYRFGQTAFDLIRPLAFAMHCRPLNVVRRKYGLPSLGHDLRQVYTDADHVFYADLPELVPTYGLPANHHYIGPILWEPAIPLPDWWGHLDAARPSVFITLGSSGPVAHLPQVLTALSRLPIQLLVATGGRLPADRLKGKGIFVADYLPARQVLARSQLVVCNGGSPMGYLALAAGRPVLGLPCNLDQLLYMDYLARAGAGVILRTGQIDPVSLLQTVQAMLAEDAPQLAAARQLQKRMAGWRMLEQLPELIARLLTGQPPGSE